MKNVFVFLMVLLLGACGPEIVDTGITGLYFTQFQKTETSCKNNVDDIEVNEFLEVILKVIPATSSEEVVNLTFGNQTWSHLHISEENKFLASTFGFTSNRFLSGEFWEAGLDITLLFDHKIEACLTVFKGYGVKILDYPELEDKTYEKEL